MRRERDAKSALREVVLRAGEARVDRAGRPASGGEDISSSREDVWESDERRGATRRLRREEVSDGNGNGSKGVGEVVRAVRR